MKVESFGPIGQVNSFSTEEEVLTKANDTEYGLYSSVFTNDITRALRIAKELEAGTVAINSAAPTATSKSAWEYQVEARSLILQSGTASSTYPLVLRTYITTPSLVHRLYLP